MRLRKALDEVFPEPPLSAVVASWLWSIRAPEVFPKGGALTYAITLVRTPYIVT